MMDSIYRKLATESLDLAMEAWNYSKNYSGNRPTPESLSTLAAVILDHKLTEATKHVKE